MKPGKELIQELEWPRYINVDVSRTHLFQINKLSVWLGIAECTRASRDCPRVRDVRIALRQFFECVEGEVLL